MSKKMISLEISDELREKLRKEAYVKNKSISAIIREILQDYFKINENLNIQS